MSDHVNSVEILASEGFSIREKVWEALLVEVRGTDERVPESSIFERGWLRVCKKKDGRLYPNTIWWGGEGSRELDLLIEHLPKFDGSVDLAFIYDSGRTEGLRLVDHRVTKHEVVMTLGEEIGD